jgi:hypothetical protein
MKTSVCQSKNITLEESYIYFFAGKSIQQQILLILTHGVGDGDDNT